MFQLQRLRVDDASVMFDQFSYSLVALNTCIYKDNNKKNLQ